MSTAPSAFISYSWDTNEHREWVNAFAARLRADGVDVILDQWNAIPGDLLPQFMLNSVHNSDFVLVICTTGYKEKSQKEGSGVRYEGDIITTELWIHGNHRKFIPILREGIWKNVAPVWLAGKIYVDMSENAPSENYQDLLFTLWGKRPQAPPIGQNPLSLEAQSVPKISQGEYVAQLSLRISKQEDTFIPIHATTPISSIFEGLSVRLVRKENGKKTEDFETIEQVIDKFEKFVLLGHPGSGKTTTLQHVAFTLAMKHRKAHKKANPSSVPFWIDLGVFDNPLDASDLLRHWWQEINHIAGDPLIELGKGSLFLLLDGLNEMPNNRAGSRGVEDRVKSLRGILAECPGKAIVTCRTADYAESLDLGLPRVTVVGLDRAQIEKFAEKYLAKSCAEFLKHLDEKPWMKILASNPYALKMMIELFADPIYEFPNQRQVLYDIYILKRYNDNRASVQGNSYIKGDLATLKRAWASLASQMLEAGLGTSVDRTWAERHAQYFSPPTRSQKWITRGLRRVGIVVARHNVLSQSGVRNLQDGLSLGIFVLDSSQNKVSFQHQSLHEFFAASVANLEEGSVEVRSFLIEELSTYGLASLEYLPRLQHILFKEKDNEDGRLYSSANRALTNICINLSTESSRRFVLTLFLDFALQVLVNSSWSLVDNLVSQASLLQTSGRDAHLSKHLQYVAESSEEIRNAPGTSYTNEMEPYYCVEIAIYLIGVLSSDDWLPPKSSDLPLSGAKVAREIQSEKGSHNLTKAVRILNALDGYKTAIKYFDDLYDYDEDTKESSEAVAEETKVLREHRKTIHGELENLSQTLITH